MVDFVDSRQLRDLIQDRKKDFQVVDLRREDFARDHIINAWHVPVTKRITADQLSRLIKELLDRFPNSQSVKVVFHCTGSKNRGPTSAIQFEEYVQVQDMANKFESCVLVGGFYAWTSFCRGSNLKLIASD